MPKRVPKGLEGLSGNPAGVPRGLEVLSESPARVPRGLGVLSGNLAGVRIAKSTKTKRSDSVESDLNLCVTHFV